MEKWQCGASDVIDIKELMEIMDNDMALLDDCFAVFVETWSEFFKEIESAVLARDATALDRAAHSFKGTLQYLAAMPAVDVVKRLELAGKSGDFTTVDEDLDSLNMACQALVRFMMSRKKC
ncbi:HPt (histidine-containing phosphotransfer) domain-containing protein [Desulfocicer vacuolatum DSM 3385]|uniref:HPt (Histidine-containing phosphotransfer) domain-containing protein n=1 Tax=Desulfocicer vacuolatum DSM 3385 TaxID=1121400 RepID=A0A1W2CQV0_9BACT|nr:Hpt domain-containing protein [Desulfocicer vacuolatum]SMC87581.1 HPt (histidine-containing phosphotransfer) domain-containing protein [Desulfocicer vacuolatum DSM 3385]